MGLKNLDKYIESHAGNKRIAGDFAFELFDTFGFPIRSNTINCTRKKGMSV